MSRSAQADRDGHFLAAAINASPTAERTAKAVYIPHLGQLVVERDQAVRLQIFEINRQMYEENKARDKILKRAEFAGGYPMQIPEYDLIMLKQKYPEARNEAPKEDRINFYKKLYMRHPEYRIG
jgi:hypothetical protein